MVRTSQCRRIAAVAVLAVVAAGCGSRAASTSPPPTTANAAGVTTTSSDRISSSQLVSVLARAGIATVATEAAKTPVAAVTGPRVMAFTSDQVEAMAGGASDHSGLLGSVLDATHPMPAGDPSYSYLLAAWVSKQTTPGAVEVRSLMGVQNWSAAPTVVFPVAALPLFTADVVHAEGTASATTASAAAADYVAPAAVTGLVDAPCSLVSGFISDVLDTVAEKLMLASPSGSGVAVEVGSFFVNLWNTAVGLAHLAIKNLIKAVTAPVLRTIESIAAGAAVVAEIVTNITPWTVAVSASPGSVSQGDSGSFTAKVSSGLGAGDYPSAVTDCAQALDITLPSLVANGTPATWTLAGPITPTGPAAVKLDSTGASTTTYRATATTRTFGDSCGGGDAGGSPSPPPGSGTGTITVTRPAINDLKTLVTNLLSTSVPVAGGVLASILEPLVDGVLGTLDKLTQVTGTGRVVVTSSSTGGGSGSAVCPTPTPQQSCLVGTWVATNVSITNAGRGPIAGGSGSRWTISANGHEVVDWDGSGAFTLAGAPGFSYEGMETETVKIPSSDGSSGPWSAHVDTDGRTAVYSAAVQEATGKKSEPVPSSAGVTDSGRWRCTTHGLTVVAAAEGSRITVDLRSAH